MYCMKCGTQVPDTASFCPSCGAALNGAQAVPPQARPVKAEKKRTNWIAILFGVLAIGLAVALGIILLGKKADDPPPQTELPTQQAAVPTQETVLVQNPADTAIPTEIPTFSEEATPSLTYTEAANQLDGHGTATFKDVVCTYTQTGEGQIELQFENKGPYDLTLYSSGRSGFGFDVVGTDEHGNKISTSITGVWQVQMIPSYSAPQVYTAAFEGLTGKIIEVRINGVAYSNTEKQFDFGNSQQIVIPGD